MSLHIAGRTDELAEIDGFLDSLAAGPAALVLEGAPGIGKTTLCRCAIDRARGRGFRILACQPAATETQLSHASLADLISDVEQAVLQIIDHQHHRRRFGHARKNRQERHTDGPPVGCGRRGGGPQRHVIDRALLGIGPRLQEDAGDELARVIVEFARST